MKIKWKLQDRFRCLGERRSCFSGILRYEPINFSALLTQQIQELETKGFAMRVRSIVLWRTQTGTENCYYVFSKLKLRRGALILQTALCSDNCSSPEIAVKSALIIPGTLRSAQEPIQPKSDQRAWIEHRALEIASAGSDVESYWHQVEVAYQSWHDGNLVGLQALRESKMRLVLRQYQGGELAELQSAYEWIPPLDLGTIDARFVEERSGLMATAI